MYRNLTFLKRWTFSRQIRFKSEKAMELKKCYLVLGVDEASDQETIRSAYLALVKLYHPDNPKGGDMEKFRQVDEAFRVLTEKKSKERWGVEQNEREEFDIKHTAPQHRQYLSYGGHGSGTPFQREKQYGKLRAAQAAENVLEHRLSKSRASENNALVDKKVPLKHKIKTKYGFDRLVEDLIQESMSKGEFNNLSGCGKPLKNADLNPYVDFVTHKLNQILIDNGFSPEWITLQKEIREEISMLREDLARARSYLGAAPLTESDASAWRATLDNFADSVSLLNRKINKFNLVVPVLEKQMLLFDVEREAAKVVLNGTHGRIGPVEKRDDEHDVNGMFDFIFKK